MSSLVTAARRKLRPRLAASAFGRVQERAADSLALEVRVDAQKHDAGLATDDRERQEPDHFAGGDRQQIQAREHVERAAEDVDIGLTQRPLAQKLDRRDVVVGRLADLELDRVRLRVGSAGHGHARLTERQVLAAGRAAVLGKWQLERVVHAGKTPRRWGPGFRPRHIYTATGPSAREATPWAAALGRLPARARKTRRRRERYHRLMDRPPLLAENPAALDALARVEVLYTDLDGTLLARGGSVVADATGAPSTATVEAIVALNRAGLTVVPVSGRTRLQLTEVVRLLGWTDFIAEVGSVLVRGAGPGRQVIYNTGEWPAHLVGDATPYELIRDSGALQALQESFPGRLEYHTPWHRDREASHLLRGCLDLAEAQDVLDTLDLPVSLARQRSRPPADPRACVPGAGARVPPGAARSQQVAGDRAWTSRRRGLSADQAAAIGDSATDLAMADAVGLMALVDNAFESAERARGARGALLRARGAARGRARRRVGAVRARVAAARGEQAPG